MFTCLAYSVRSLGMTQQEARFTWLMHGFTCTPPKKTKHSPKNIHETITQKIHKKTFTALLSGQLSTTTGMLCSILFGGITQADIFFMPLVFHEMVLHHMRFFSRSRKASCSERHLLPHRLPRHSLVENQQGS